MRLDEGHAKGFFKNSQEMEKVENQVAFSARKLFFSPKYFHEIFHV